MSDPKPNATITYHGTAMGRSTQTTTMLDIDFSTAVVARSDDIELEEIIGEGGMAVVHRARQLFPVRDVAVKKLRQPDPRLAGILLNEAVTMGALEHPNIVPVHLVKMDTEYSPEVVMKCVHGRSLHEAFGGQALRGEALRAQLRVLCSVCRALEFAHDRGVVHRDVKTENIMIGEFGETYLLDWGIAIRLADIDTVPLGVVGTPAYMAPEMLSGDPADVSPLTDVYQLGALLHELLLGIARHDATTTRAALAQVRESVPYEFPDDVPPDLAALTNDACAKAPSARPASVTVFREAIEHHLEVWEAVQIRDAAQTKLAALEALVGSERTDVEYRHDIRQLFSEARFGFTQAENLAADCPGAQAGLQKTIEVMLGWCLAGELMGESEVLLGSLSDPSPALRRAVDALKARQASQAKKVDRLRRFGATYSRTPTRKGRIILAACILASIVLMVVGVSIYDTFFPEQVSARRLSYTTGTLAAFAVIGCFLGRRSLYANRLGGHLTSSIILGFVCAAFIAVIGDRLGASAAVVMSAEMLLCCMAMVNAYPVVGLGRWGGGYCAAAVLVSALVPRVTHICLLFCGVVCAALIFYDWFDRDWHPRDLETTSDHPAV